MQRGPLHPTRIDIPIEVRVQVIDILGVTLGSFADLSYQVKTAHWNIKSPKFMMLHLFFDSLYEDLPDIVDTIAERIQALGGTSLGTIRLAAQSSILPEFPYLVFDEVSYLDALADRYAMITKHLRDSADIMGELPDLTTQNYYLDLARQMDKALWFIQSHL